MKKIWIVGIYIIIGGTVLWTFNKHEIMSIDASSEADKPTDDLTRWLNERDKPKILKDTEVEKARTAAFLLSLDHYRYILKPDSTIEEAISYAKSHWKEYIDRPDIDVINIKIRNEKQLRKKRK